MKYMLLIHQGDTPTPYDRTPGRASREDEQNAVYAAYQAINQTPGRHARACGCSRPRPRRPCASRTARR